VFLRNVCIVLATAEKKGWSRALTIESLALSLEMSTAVRWRGLGRVNFGPLLVNLEFGERKGQLNFTSCSQMNLYIQYLYTWIPGCSMDATAMTPDQGEAVKPVTREALHVEDYVFLEAHSQTRDHIQQHISTMNMSRCLSQSRIYVQKRRKWAVVSLESARCKVAVCIGASKPTVPPAVPQLI